MRAHSSCLFQTGKSLLVDFDLCASTRLVFFDIARAPWRRRHCRRLGGGSGGSGTEKA